VQFASATLGILGLLPHITLEAYDRDLAEYRDNPAHRRAKLLALQRLIEVLEADRQLPAMTAGPSGRAGTSSSVD